MNVNMNVTQIKDNFNIAICINTPRMSFGCEIHGECSKMSKKATMYVPNCQLNCELNCQIG